MFACSSSRGGPSRCLLLIQCSGAVFEGQRPAQPELMALAGQLAHPSWGGVRRGQRAPSVELTIASEHRNAHFRAFWAPFGGHHVAGRPRKPHQWLASALPHWGTCWGRRYSRWAISSCAVTTFQIVGPRASWAWVSRGRGADITQLIGAVASAARPRSGAVPGHPSERSVVFVAPDVTAVTAS